MEALQEEAFEKDIRNEKEFRTFAEDLVRDLFDISHALGEVVQEILSAYHRVQVDEKRYTESHGGQSGDQKSDRGNQAGFGKSGAKRLAINIFSGKAQAHSSVSGSLAVES